MHRNPMGVNAVTKRPPRPVDGSPHCIWCSDEAVEDRETAQEVDLERLNPVADLAEYDHHYPGLHDAAYNPSFLDR